MTDDEDAHADYRDTCPAKKSHLFAEEQQSENGNHEIGKRRGRLYVTVVRPGEHKHVGNEKGKQACNSEPDVAGSKNPKQNVKKLLGLPVARGADVFHSFAEQHIAERGKKSNEKKENIGFQVQAWRIFHAILMLLPRETPVLFLELSLFILLDVGLVSKALKGEIVRFLLFFCFATELFRRRVCGGIPAQGVQ